MRGAEGAEGLAVSCAALAALGAVCHLQGTLVVSNGSREHNLADPVPCRARKECPSPAAAEMPGG